MFPSPRILLPICIVIPASIICYFFDSEILSFVQFFQNPLFDKLANWITSMISLVFVFLVVGFAFMFEARKTKWIVPTISSLLITISITYGAKFIFMRRRPFDHSGFLGMVDTSFPSSHASTSFTCAVILSRVFPRISWFFYSFAIGISLSRLYLEKHYLSDILPGALIGYLVGSFIVWWCDEFVFNPHQSFKKYFHTLKTKLIQYKK